MYLLPHEQEYHGVPYGGRLLAPSDCLPLPQVCFWTWALEPVWRISKTTTMDRATVGDNPSHFSTGCTTIAASCSKISTLGRSGGLGQEDPEGFTLPCVAFVFFSTQHTVRYRLRGNPSFTKGPPPDLSGQLEPLSAGCLDFAALCSVALSWPHHRRSDRSSFSIDLALDFGLIFSFCC